MPPSDSDSDSGWNKELITAVSKKQGKTKTISEEDRIKQIQECLDEDADIDTVDGNGNTALDMAVKRGYQMVAEFLRKAGARTNIPNRNGQTAISLARDLGKQEIMSSLNPQDSNSDQSLSEMRLTKAPQADPQRDVMTSDEPRSNRKRTIEHTERPGRMTLTAQKMKYPATQGLKGGFHGYWYQVKFLMYIMYRARELKYSFRLATEMKAAEDFDDVVLRSEDSKGDVRYRFLQVKHKQNKNQAISAEALSNIKGDFSLLKYFISWRKIERNRSFAGSKSKDFILCTNIGVNVEDLKSTNITVVEETETDDLLNLSDVKNEKRQPRRYKLSIENTSSIWKTLKSSSEGEITDSEISRFLDKFILAVNLPNETELGKIIECKIGAEFNLLDYGIVSDSFKIELWDWLTSKDGVFLTDVHADEFFNKMRNELDAIRIEGVDLDHRGKLQELGIRFNGVNREIQNFINSHYDGSKRILEIISPTPTLLTALQVCQTLVQRQKSDGNEIVTFVSLKTLSRETISQLVLGVFKGSANRNLLIVDCESTNAKQKLQSLSDPMGEIMAKNVDRKMILITQKGKDLGSKYCLDRETCHVDKTEYRFENLAHESQKKLLGRRVTKFQKTENETNFAGLLDIPDWDHLEKDDVKDLSNIMDTESLVRLISQDELQIGRKLNGLKDVEEYYVHRTIFRHVVIKKDILKDTKETDLIAISGLSGSIETCIQDELSRIGGPASRAQTRTNLTPLPQDREEEKFNDLCARNEHRNVHWLMKEHGRYIWKKSFGKITYLLQYRDDSESVDINDKTGVTHLDEDQLAAHNDPVIISDTAGMGKSTMLTSLASKIKEREPDMLVLKIDLTDYSTALAEVKKSSYDLDCIDGAIQFLVKELLRDETNFSRKVFRRILERNHKVALLFDGFDEISPDYEQTVIDLLQTLVNHGIRKLLVATRPHTRRLLEAKLNAFSFEIQPFSTDDQERFLTRFWETKLENSHRIEKYAVAIMKTLADSINDERNNFTANPLQAKLVAEVFERHNEGVRENFDSCKDFIESQADEPKFPEKINIIYLYEHFAEKKFEIFFKKRGGNLVDPGVLADKERRRELFVAQHETLALKALFDKDKIEKLLSQQDSSYGSPVSTDLKDCIERDGIITQLIDGQPRFGHQTYAEYFAAKFFSKMLTKRERNKSFAKIFVAHVLLEDKYETMRAFINWLLTDESNDVLEGEFWIRFVKDHRSEHKETIFHLAAVEGNGHIIRIVLNCFSANKEDRKVIIHHLCETIGETAVHRAVKYGHLDIIKLLAEDTDFEINCQDVIGQTPLFQAAEIGALDIVRYFIDKRADVNLPTNDGKTPLYIATKEGRSEMVKYLLEKGADVNLPSDRGETPLYIATEEGQSEMVKYLLEKGANINSRTNDGETPLYIATEEGQSEMVKYLLEKGANINSRTNDGETLLHAAAYGGHWDLADYLLEKGVDVNSQRNDGMTPLYTAAWFAKLEMVKCLLEKGADVNLPTNDGKTPLYIATKEGRLEMVKYLREKGANINSRTNDGETLLHAAAFEGNLDSADYLLEKGADVNLPTNDGKTPLYIATKEGRSEMVKYLLEKGANINSRTNDGETPLYIATEEGLSEMVKYLLEKGANINSRTNDGETPLYIATEEGQSEMVKYLLEKGANINSRTNDGETLLHAAAYGGHWDLADYLLEKGADVNSQRNDGMTPLYTAAWFAKLEMVKCLLEKGADVNFATNDGKTPLYIATKEGLSEMVKYLLEKGANINSRTNDGETLLHAAAYGGNLNLADLLLEKGADVNLRSNDGRTPLYIATEKRRSEMVKYLLEKGANINSRTDDGETLLHAAAYGGNLNLADLLLEKGADVNLRSNDGRTPLYIATEEGLSEMVKYLLEKGANINSRTNDGETLLHAAACGGELDIADSFFEKGVDVNLPTNHGKTPLYMAARSAESEMVKYLLEKGADTNSRTNDGETLLHAAAYRGHLDLADHLLEKGADVNSRSNDGRTPLYIATEEGLSEMVKYLLEKGANINSRTNDGETLLHAAACGGELDIADSFFEKGVDVNLPTNHGKTPLYMAARSAESEMVKYLLEKGANINSRTDDGETLLHAAAYGGNLNLADLLLEKGADVNLRSNDGRTPLYIATEEGRSEMVKYLLEKGANINSRSNEGWMALDVATHMGRKDIVKYLLEMRAPGNSLQTEG